MVKPGHVNGIAAKALRVLMDTPLCDRCLGRLFARLGYGWSNKDRGDSIKKYIIMDLHMRASRGDDETRRILINVASNIGVQASGVYKNLTGEELKANECSLCGGGLDAFIRVMPEKILPLLRLYNVRKFVVGVKAKDDIVMAEEELKRRHNLEFTESIKAEIRREIGKALQQASDSLTVDFEDPEATVLVSYPDGDVSIQVNSLLLSGIYWKRGRLISQAYWPTPTGPKYYSIEEALWSILRATGGSRVILHAAGREDVDARMLGTGRPMIVEIKEPRRREVDKRELEEAVERSSRGLVAVNLAGKAKRRDITYYKEETSRLLKTYKALIASEDPLGEADIEHLEREISERIIMQRTPRRVLHRRPDILRTRRVHKVKCAILSEHVLECLIVADSGLYIKELISGDDGRTRPSFAEILNKTLTCVELDVIAVKGTVPGVEDRVISPKP